MIKGARLWWGDVRVALSVPGCPGPFLPVQALCSLSFLLCLSIMESPTASETITDRFHNSVLGRFLSCSFLLCFFLLLLYSLCKGETRSILTNQSAAQKVRFLIRSITHSLYDTVSTVHLLSGIPPARLSSK